MKRSKCNPVVNEGRVSDNLRRGHSRKGTADDTETQDVIHKITH